jgi:hypothetical protein
MVYRNRTVVIFAIIYYLIHGRQSYQPPTEQVKKVVVGTDSFDVALNRFEAEQQQQQQQVIMIGEKQQRGIRELLKHLV